MADSASDPKVEDVLSSVRRLVSQEIPKRPAAKPSADDGALLLTSKDRIAEEHSARVAAKSLEQRIAELEKAVDDGTEEFEPDGSEDQAQHRPDRIVYTRPRSSEIGVERTRSALRLSEIALIETGPAQEPEPKSETPVEFRRGTTKPAPEAPMAEDVPTLPASTAEVRAFSDPDDVVARIEARIERGGEEPAPEPQAQADTRNDAADEQDFDAALTAAVRASIAVQGKTSGEEPPHKGDTLQLDETLAVASDPEAAAPETSRPTEEALKPTESEPSDTHHAADALVSEPVAHPHVKTRSAEDATRQLSEAKVAAVVDTSNEGPELSPVEAAETALNALPEGDALRLLVARLMREELSGALGERITQSVRKLVRSEVKRVLESRTLV